MIKYWWILIPLAALLGYWLRIAKAYPFQNSLRQNYKCLKTVQELIDFLLPEQITELVTFTGNADFKTPRPSDVYSLETLISYLKNLNEELLTENRMQFCIGRLEHLRFSLTEETDVKHWASLSRRV